MTEQDFHTKYKCTYCNYVGRNEFYLTEYEGMLLLTCPECEVMKVKILLQDEEDKKGVNNDFRT